MPTCKKGGQHATAGNTNRGVVWLLEKPGVGAGEEVTEEMFWHFCGNCHGLFHVKGDADVVDYGKCNHAKTGTDHVVASGSAMYIMEVKEGFPAGIREKRTAYFECEKCAGLYHPWRNGTACNAGGEHTPFGYKHYTLKAK